MTSDSVITLPDTNDARVANPKATVHRDDFVETGCQFTVDYDGLECVVDRGVIHYAYAGTYYRVEVGTLTPSNELDLTDGAINDIYYDFGNVQLVATTGSAPAEPSMKIGSVDTTNDTFDDTLNRVPSVDRGAVNLSGPVDAGGNDINNVGALSTVDLVDTDDGQTWETLRELGYETGDRVSFMTSLFSGEASTSSTSFVFPYNSDRRFTPTPSLPTGAEARIHVEYGGTDATARLAEVDMFGNQKGGFVNSEVSTTDNPGFDVSDWVSIDSLDPLTVGFGVELKSNDGSSQFMRQTSIEFGVQL